MRNMILLIAFAVVIAVLVWPRRDQWWSIANSYTSSTNYETFDTGFYRTPDGSVEYILKGRVVTREALQQAVPYQLPPEGPVFVPFLIGPTETRTGSRPFPPPEVK